MVIPLRPGKFYGSSLPRPRFYTDVKYSDERVDPPVSVLDPLMSWAEEAHWSMGGLSFNRLRLQGKIEGNVKKLKKEREASWKKKMENSTPISESKKGFGSGGRSRVDSPPPAPISKKRRQRKFIDDEDEFEDEDEDEDEDEEEVEIEIESRKKLGKNRGIKTSKKRRRLVRKLGDDFELVGVENGENERTPSKDLGNGGVSKSVASRTRSRRSMVLMDEDEEGEGDGDVADNGGKLMSKGKKNGVENGKSENISVTHNKNGVEDGKSEKISVTPKKNRRNSSVSASGSRSSPRLKQKSN